jgi:uncharacterized protein (DUF2267 family)
LKNQNDAYQALKATHDATKTRLAALEAKDFDATITEAELTELLEIYATFDENEERY